MRPYPWTRFHDERIRRAYASGEKGAIGRLAKEFGVTPNAVRLRGIRIGAAIPKRAAGDRKDWWSRKEDEIVAKNVHLGIQAIVDALRKAGFERNRKAVIGHLHVMRLRGDIARLEELLENRDEYSPGQIATGMGVDIRLVRKWIHRGWLRARTFGEAGDSPIYAVRRANLRSFLVDHVAHWEIGLADKHWVVDLLADTERLKPSRKCAGGAR